MKVGRRTLAAACAVIGAVLLGGLVFRRPMLTWGATPEETTANLPGDELLPHADLVATRAITITVPPRDVWPWLVQIGSGRAGAYSYDWLERVAGLDIHSSYRIVPQLQDLSIGDVIPVESDGTGLRVRLMEPDRLLGTCTDDGTWAWTWLLEPAGERHAPAEPHADVDPATLTVGSPRHEPAPRAGVLGHGAQDAAGTPPAGRDRRLHGAIGPLRLRGSYFPIRKMIQ